MTITKYTPEFVFELGDTYESRLDSAIKTKLLILRNKVNKNSTNEEIKSLPKESISLKWRTETASNPPEREKTVEDYAKEIYLHLNKLSETNIDVIAFEINTIIQSINASQDKSVLVEKSINRLFESAKIQINFCHLYAHLFYKLIDKDKQQYSKKLEQKIKEEFLKIENLKNVSAEKDYDEYCANVNLKDNYLGCYQFCVELYNYMVLTYNNLEQILEKVLVDLDNQTDKYQLEIIIECLCRIIQTIRKSNRLEKQEKQKIINGIHNKYTQNCTKLKPRSKFIFEDILHAKTVS